MGTNYEEVAPTFDQRYERHAYAGIAATLLEHVGPAPRSVLEVGCGTGHWLGVLAENGHLVTGLDASRGMLDKARAKLPEAPLVHGQAEQLPFASGCFERVVMINTLHHFAAPQQALREARRVLSASGCLLIIGLDPSSELDSWVIYDYFPSSLQRDRVRFPATSTLRSWLSDAGFAASRSFVAERIEHSLTARAALESGALARHTTSQLSELSDADYARGMAEIEQAATAAEAQGTTLSLHARLHLFATVGRCERQGLGDET